MSNESSKADKPKRSFGRPSWVIFQAFSIFLISQLIAGFLVAIAIGYLRPAADAINLLNNSALAQFFFLVLAEGMAVGLVLYVLKKRQFSLKTIGLRKPTPNDIKRGLVGFAVFYAMLIIVLTILNQIFPQLDDTPQNIGFNNVSGVGALLAFIALVFLPPIGEEVLIRGYLFTGLRMRTNFIRAGLITSLLFSLAHLQLGDGAAPAWGAGAATFLLSLVLVYLRETTGALYAGILVHMLNNFVAFLVKFH